MSRLHIREKVLIVFMILMILLVFFFWGIKKLDNHEELLRLQIENREFQIKKIRLLSNEWQKLQRTLTAPIMSQALSSFVENPV